MAAPDYLSDPLTAQQRAATKRRMLAEQLQQSAMTPGDDPATHTPGGRISWLNPLAKAVSAGLGAHMADRADSQLRDLAEQQRSQLTTLLINDMPRATPAVEENAPPSVPAPDGVGPDAPGVGPTRPAAPALVPDASAWATYGAKLAASDHPGVNALGQKIAGDAYAQMIPKDYRSNFISTGGGDVLDVSDPKAPKFVPGAPLATARLDETWAKMFSDRQARADALKARSEDVKLSVDQRRDAANQHAQLMRELALGRRQAADASADAVKNETYQTVGTHPDTGKSIVQGNKTGAQYVPGFDEDGRPTLTPYKGQVITKGDEKRVNSATDMQAEADQSRALAAAVKKNPGAFSAYKSGVSNITNRFAGGMGSEELGGPTGEENVLRSQIYDNFADKIHARYGASVTPGETSQARQYTIAPGDSAEKIQEKLIGQAKTLEQMRERRFGGNKIGAAADARASTNSTTSTNAATPASKSGAKPSRQDLLNLYPGSK